MAWRPSSKEDRGSVRLSYDGDENLEYVGFNTIDGIDETLETWQVLKLVYAADTLSYVEGPLVGAWDSRTSLDWS